MISADTFRADLKAFSNPVTYDDDAINFWIAVSVLMLNVTVPLTVAAVTNAVTAPGGAVLNFSSAPGSVVNGMVVADLSRPAIPANVFVQSIAGGAVTLSAPVVAPGVSSGDVIFFSGGQLTSPKWGAGSAVPVSPPATLLDIATELFVAHNLVLEKRAQDAANVGGLPGQIIGPVASKSVGSVSISYDASAGLEPEAGHWNTTMYGLRFIKLARMKGMGPVQVGIGVAPPWSGGAWPGPWPYPQPGGSGFG